MTLGEFLKKKRLALKQTQVESARRCGVRHETWRNWERGGIPGADKIGAIADWAGVTLNRLRPYLDRLGGGTES